MLEKQFRNKRIMRNILEKCLDGLGGCLRLHMVCMVVWWQCRNSEFFLFFAHLSVVINSHLRKLICSRLRIFKVFSFIFAIESIKNAPAVKLRVVLIGKIAMFPRNISDYQLLTIFESIKFIVLI